MTSQPVARRPLAGRIAHGLSWRVEALRKHLDERMPYFFPLLRELRATTGRGTLDLSFDLLSAWKGYGVDPRNFGALMLADIPKDRWHDFIVGADLDRFLAATLDPEDRLLSRDKAGFAEHDRRFELPWLPTLAVINRREGCTITDAVVVEREDQLGGVLADLGRDRDLVLKPSCGQRGNGFYLRSKTGELRNANGSSIELAALARIVLNYTHRLGAFGYVVQPALAPHPAIVELTGSRALTTVRVVTALKDGVPHVIESFLKIPGPGRLTDNFRDGETGTLIAGFDSMSGRLTDLVGLLRPGNRYVLERTSVHPVSGKRVSGAELPRWKEAVDLAYRAALAHSRTTTMGWDIALAANGWFILDGNPNWGPGWQPGSVDGVRPLLAQLFPADF